MEPFFNSESIFVKDASTKPSEAVKEFIESYPKPEIVLMDAYWPEGNGKELLSRFLDAGAKVILITNYYDPFVLIHFFPLQPHGYVFRHCDDHTMITNCIRQVFSGVNCFNAP